jgi:SET domain-containing protein
MNSKKIYIAKSGIKNAGRGVFASVDIKKNEIIEICPILILSDKDSEHVMETLLQNYVYEYAKDSTMIALGYGSLYNNMDAPNAKYELQEYEGMPEQDNELLITAIRPIAKNEEIFIDYGIQDYFKTLNH